MTAIYTLTSPLHDQASVESLTKEFLSEIGIAFEFKGNDFSSYGEYDLNLIHIRTGGTENLFKELFPKIKNKPVYLLTSGKSNSLAASMEILSFLRQHGAKGEIIHGSPEYIRTRIELLLKASQVRKRLRNMRLGVIGKPSDWLISSTVNRSAVKEKLGMDFADIPMERLIRYISEQPASEDKKEDALRIYSALKRIISEENLSGITVRCFDLLDTVHNTGCLALAKLNAEGIPAGCEGDIPALISMAVSSAATGFSGFQANPASIDPQTGRAVFAHCTIPLNMVTSYSLTTHYESGIGVGIHGEMPTGDVTVFKMSGENPEEYFVAEAELESNQYKEDLCRTQVVLKFKDSESKAILQDYFLKRPIGNHHIIIPGKVAALLNEVLRCE